AAAHGPSPVPAAPYLDIENMPGGTNSDLSPIDLIKLFRGFVGKNGRRFVIFDGGWNSRWCTNYSCAGRIPATARAEPLLACLPCNLMATRSADHRRIASEGERHGTPSIFANSCLRNSAACSGSTDLPSEGSIAARASSSASIKRLAPPSFRKRLSS